MYRRCRRRRSKTASSGPSSFPTLSVDPALARSRPSSKVERLASASTSSTTSFARPTKRRAELGGREGVLCSRKKWCVLFSWNGLCLPFHESLFCSHYTTWRHCKQTENRTSHFQNRERTEKARESRSITESLCGLRLRLVSTSVVCDRAIALSRVRALANLRRDARFEKLAKKETEIACCHVRVFSSKFPHPPARLYRVIGYSRPVQ